MPLDRSNFNLFGLDLYRLYDQGRQGFAEIARWPLFQRLLPVDSLRVHQPDGSVAIMSPAGPRPQRGDEPVSGLTAILLPDELVLSASLRLPGNASYEECQQAVALAVQADCPFPPEDTAWGVRIDPMDHGAASSTLVRYAMAARSHVARHCAERDVPPDAEVWAWVEGAPVVLDGYGEHRRHRIRRQRLLQVSGLVALFLLLLVALAAVPVLHRRQQAFDAQNDYQALASRAAPAAAAREALGRANARIAALRQHVEGLPDPGWLLVSLTALLPDSVYLTQLDTKGGEAVIRGTADNAGALVELLGAAPGISEVRPASAIVRNPATGRETFVIQFRFRVPDTNPESAR